MAAYTRRAREMMGLLRVLRNVVQGERMLHCFIFSTIKSHFTFSEVIGNRTKDNRHSGD